MPLLDPDVVGRGRDEVADIPSRCSRDRVLGVGQPHPGAPRQDRAVVVLIVVGGLGVDHRHPRGPGGFHHHFQRLAHGLDEAQVPLHARAAGSAEIVLHVDDHQRRVLRPNRVRQLGPHLLHLWLPHLFFGVELEVGNLPALKDGPPHLLRHLPVHRVVHVALDALRVLADRHHGIVVVAVTPKVGSHGPAQQVRDGLLHGIVAGDHSVDLLRGCIRLELDENDVLDHRKPPNGSGRATRQSGRRISDDAGASQSLFPAATAAATPLNFRRSRR